MPTWLGLAKRRPLITGHCISKPFFGIAVEKGPLLRVWVHIYIHLALHECRKYQVVSSVVPLGLAIAGKGINLRAALSSEG